MAVAKKNDYFGKRLNSKKAEAVVGELREMMLGLVDRWILKGAIGRRALMR